MLLFDNIIKFEDFGLNNISVDEKSYGSISVFNISYKTLNGTKFLDIRFDKIDGFNIVYDGTRYLVSFGAEKYDLIYNRIRYLIGVKGGIKCIISHN